MTVWRTNQGSGKRGLKKRILRSGLNKETAAKWTILCSAFAASSGCGRRTAGGLWGTACARLSTHTLIETEPTLSARLPRAAGEGRRGRGFPAAATNNSCVADAAQPFGDSRRSLARNIDALEKAQANFPKQLREMHFESWSEVRAELEEDGKLKRRVRDYIKYRVWWSARKCNAPQSFPSTFSR